LSSIFFDPDGSWQQASFFAASLPPESIRVLRRRLREIHADSEDFEVEALALYGPLLPFAKEVRKDFGLVRSTGRISKTYYFTQSPQGSQRKASESSGSKTWRGDHQAPMRPVQVSKMTPAPQKSEHHEGPQA